MASDELGKNYQLVYHEIKKEKELWRLFTGIDEYTPKKFEEHGRYTYASSLKRDTFKPSVSEYLHLVYLIMTVISQLISTDMTGFERLNRIKTVYKGAFCVGLLPSVEVILEGF